MKKLFNFARFIMLPVLFITNFIKRIILLDPTVKELNAFTRRYSTLKLDFLLIILFVLLIVSIVVWFKNR